MRPGRRLIATLSSVKVEELKVEAEIMAQLVEVMINSVMGLYCIGWIVEGRKTMDYSSVRVTRAATATSDTTEAIRSMSCS